MVWQPCSLTQCIIICRGSSEVCHPVQSLYGISVVECLTQFELAAYTKFLTARSPKTLKTVWEVFYMNTA